MATQRYRDQFGNILNLSPEDAHKRSTREHARSVLTPLGARKVVTDFEHAEAAATDTVDNKRVSALDAKEAELQAREEALAAKEAELGEKAKAELGEKAKAESDNKARTNEKSPSTK